MKTLQIDGKKAKRLYEDASPEFQAVLEDTFGKKFFKSVQDRVASYEDACYELGLNPEGLPEVHMCEAKDRDSIIAFYKLTIIARALNEGWSPNWANINEYKWIPWFRYLGATSGLGCSHTLTTPSSAVPMVGSRLCFKSEELAAYFGNQFKKLWAEYLTVEER